MVKDANSESSSNASSTSHLFSKVRKQESDYTGRMLQLLTSKNLTFTVCTVSFNIPNFYISRTLHLHVLYVSQNEHRMLFCTAVTDWFL